MKILLNLFNRGKFCYIVFIISYIVTHCKDNYNIKKKKRRDKNLNTAKAGAPKTARPLMTD